MMAKSAVGWRNVRLRDFQILPSVWGRGTGSDYLAREDAVHLTLLWKDEQAFLVEMVEEMILVRKPEALFDQKQFVLKAHSILLSSERRSNARCSVKPAPEA